MQISRPLKCIKCGEYLPGKTSINYLASDIICGPCSYKHMIYLVKLYKEDYDKEKGGEGTVHVSK